MICSDALIDRYSNWTSWCQDSNASNVSCSEYAGYPLFYYEDIKQDRYDLVLEQWEIEEDYIDDGSVLNLGISGVYGEQGWFVPKYVYEDQEHQHWVLLQKLRNDKSLRSTFINAYTVNSSTNWYEYWWSVWNNSLDEYLEYGYDIPDAATPIIWGSQPDYAISQHSQRLTNNVLDNGLNWTFVALGSETALTNLIQDLCAKRLPFIANLYSPHLDFATTLENDTEYMDYETIALPRNSNNNEQSQCFVDGKCTFPWTPLMKLANPNLIDEFEEIYDFVSDFTMFTTDVNSVLAFHSQINDTLNMTEHEKWQYAACQWLQLNSSNGTIASWYQDITRYDCIFSDTENCGFDYFYNSYDDAVNGQNAVNISWDDSIAGDCTYDSNEPLCECPDEYFVGDSCRTSCDGVIGPIWNDSHDGDYLSESRFVSSENYTFYLCSGHGLCDIDTKLCECEDGYGGDGCEVKYEIFEYDTAMVILWTILYGICIVVLSLSMWWVHVYREYKTVRALAPKLVYFFTFGMILLCIGNILSLFHPVNDYLCNARQYANGIGGLYINSNIGVSHFVASLSLALLLAQYGIPSILSPKYIAVFTITAPLCKTYRVMVVFEKARKLEKVNIPDIRLIEYIVGAAVVEGLICVTYSVFHQLNGGVEKIYWDDISRTEWVCNQSTEVLYVNTANYMFVNLSFLYIFYNRKYTNFQYNRSGSLWV